MSDKVDIEDVQVYAEVLAERMGQEEEDKNLYLCACILAAADRVSAAMWYVSQEVYNAHNPSAD